MFLIADWHHSHKTIGLGPNLGIVNNSELTHFKLITDFESEGFLAEGLESERNSSMNVPVSKSICESSLNGECLNIR